MDHDTLSDLSEVQRLNAEQALAKKRLQSLVNVLQYDADSIQKLLDYALNEALEMTSSRYGYIYYYDEDKQQFILNSWSHGVMDSCSVANPQTLYDLEKTGIWGEAVRQRKPIIINDFTAPDPLKKGYPEGHVPLLRFMTIPLFDKNKIVAVIGMANKDDVYDDLDVIQLTLLMDAVWKASERKRMELSLYETSAVQIKEISQRMRAEEDLKQKNSELERFIYTVSHDLKSPLVTIKAFLGYLEQDMATADQARIDMDMGYIRSAADKMEQLLSELLELARVGRAPVIHENLLLHDIIQESLRLVAGGISKRGVRVTVAESTMMLYGAHVRFVEVWQNLIENAVKYMGNQAEAHIEIGFERTSDEVLFFVRDNGIGIAASYQENIFGLFNKLDAGSEGSGLGLALVKRIVEMYGGRIWVESSGTGQGSCFHFTLPHALSAPIDPGSVTHV